MNMIKRFLKSEDGPTATEYAVMLALIILAAVVLIQRIGGKTDASFASVGNSIPDGRL